MMRFRMVVGGAILLAVTLLAGCRGEGNNGNAVAPAKTAGEASNTTSASPAQTMNAQATPTQAAASTTPATSAASADSLPVTDAVAFRDRLLELAKSARFDAQSNASANADAIRAAWRQQYPALKFVLFYSMPADAGSVSASDTFLISGTSGNFDQLYTFAVMDTKGKCAAGAALIPGDAAARKTSEAKVPTVFKPIDMSNAKTCSGRDAGDNYKP